MKKRMPVGSRKQELTLMKKKPVRAASREGGLEIGQAAALKERLSMMKKRMPIVKKNSILLITLRD